jgi:beta-galactosidase
VVDHSGSPETRVFQEVSAHGVLLKKLHNLCGAKNQNQVAILFDWETRWALETSCLPREFGPDRGYMDTLEQCYRPLWERGIGVDIRSRSDDLSQYRLVVLPMGYVLTEAEAHRLETFVKNGGILLATWLTGRVGSTNLCHLGGFPGPDLRRVFGIWAEELDQTSASDNIVAKGQNKNWNIRGGIDRVRLEGARAVASLCGDPLNEGLPALTQHRYGKGQAWYCAARPAETAGFSAVLEAVVAETPIKGLITSPQNGLSVTVRSDGKQEWIFVLNFHDQQSAQWQAPKDCTDAETGAAITAELILPPLGSRVLLRPL